MRSAILSFAVTLATCLLLAASCALSNADFVYMCAGAALLDSGQLLASPYFPAGYPLLLWLGVQCGLSALASGMLLSALGTALSAGCVTWLARSWGLPAAPALLSGLAAASLPSLFQTALNPSLDALYTGLALLLFSAALTAVRASRDGGPSPASLNLSLLSAVLATLLLCSLRYHALLPVLAVLVLLFSYRGPARSLGLAVLFAAVLATGANMWLLQRATGEIKTAGAQQLAVGAEYRAAAARGEDSSTTGTRIYEDYATFSTRAAMPEPAVLLQGVRLNWPQYLLRKPVLAGLALWLLGLVVRRRQTAGALWLVLFIPLYTLPLSAAYFTERATALPELCGMLLAVGGLTTLAFSTAPARTRGRSSQPAPRLDPALLGGLVSLGLVAASGYNAWREAGLWQSWRAERSAILAADQAALAQAQGDRQRIYAPFALSGWSGGAQQPALRAFLAGQNPYSLPGASWTRYWLDDPRVAGQIDKLLPKYGIGDVASGATPVRVIVLWPGKQSPAAQELHVKLKSPGKWTPKLQASAYEIWTALPGEP